MGAESRVDILTGSTLKGAFQEAQDQDVRDNGHSYTGGLGMARGYRIVSKPLPQFAAVRLGERLLGDRTNGPQKWEEAHVIPVASISNARSFELVVDVTSLNWDQRQDAVEAAIKPKLRAGEAISEAIISSADSWRGDSKSKGTKEEKIVKTLGKGKLIKRYLVAQQFGERGQQTILGGFDTLELAQEYAVQVAERQHGTDFTIMIWPYQEREGAPYYTYQKKVVKETVHVHAIVGVPSGEPSAWVVAGVYSC